MKIFRIIGLFALMTITACGNSQKSGEKAETVNTDGFHPFHQPHYMLLNLAIGSNGDNPYGTAFQKCYEVDYVRVYQER